MSKEKAYKLLAIQKNISNGKAKELIDSGLVSINQNKIKVARVLLDIDVWFDVAPRPETKVIFEDDDILVVDKAPFQTAAQVENLFKRAILLNRLDKETSGVMLFAKNEKFQKKAIGEFKNKRVYKEYIAIVHGKVAQELVINKPISTTKGKTANSRVDIKYGKTAKTTITPMFIEGNYSKIKVVIEDGRTHQIRVHLSHIGHPIVGDTIYGKKSSHTKRVMLHSKITKIFDYEFVANTPKEFKLFGFC
ncbi:MAG: RNA pseudouridine synthase [Campylobacteraceae bacterium 4484_166]|nr:MAG: RNA pseudouridine synthase [Campylobacteraceae bacterium 4484_166]